MAPPPPLLLSRCFDEPRRLLDADFFVDPDVFFELCRFLERCPWRRRRLELLLLLESDPDDEEEDEDEDDEDEDDEPEEDDEDEELEEERERCCCFFLARLLASSSLLKLVRFLSSVDRFLAVVFSWYSSW